MAHGGPRQNSGGSREGSGRKKTKAVVPIAALSLVAPSPASSSPSPNPEDSKTRLLKKLQELAEAGNTLAMRLVLEQELTAARIELLKEQTKLTKAKTEQITGGVEGPQTVIIVPEKRKEASWAERAQAIRDEQQAILKARLGNE